MFCLEGQQSCSISKRSVSDSPIVHSYPICFYISTFYRPLNRPPSIGVHHTANMPASNYKGYLKYGVNILRHALEMLSAAHDDFRQYGGIVKTARASRIASILAKHPEDDTYNHTLICSFATDYIKHNVGKLTVKELSVLKVNSIRYLIRRVLQKGAFDDAIPETNNKEELAKFLHQRRFRNQRIAVGQAIIDEETRKTNERVQAGRAELARKKLVEEEPTVNDAFLERALISKEGKSIVYTIDLTGDDRQFLVDNMRNYVVSRIFKHMIFSDRLKVDFWLDDGSHHFEHFKVTDLVDLYEKFSDHNWDKVTDEIHPTEGGSDMLILHVDMKHITKIEFHIMSEERNGYQTRAGLFFKYTVDSYTPLTDYQIVSEMNAETVKLIDEHCLVYAFEQAGVSKDVLSNLRMRISRSHFKMTDLEEIADFYNLNVKVSYYTLDEDYSKSSNIKVFTFPKHPNDNPSKTVDLVIIDEHYMINKPIRFNINYYNHEEEILKWLSELKETDPKRHQEYYPKRFLFQKFNGKYMKFFAPDAVPLHSIYEVLRSLKLAGKFKEIRVSDYWAYYGGIRCNDISKERCLMEPNRFETIRYMPPMISETVNLDVKHQYIVFADFEASTDGECHSEYCICARKYSVTVTPSMKEITASQCMSKSFRSAHSAGLTPGNLVIDKSFEISSDYSTFACYDRDCAVRFLDWLDSSSTVFFHNLTYDINFVLKHVDTFKRGIIFHGRDMMHNVQYKGKDITFKDSFAMINTKLSAFPGMFKLDSGRKEAFPYTYYNSKRAFAKRGSISEAVKHVKQEDREQFLQNVESIDGVKTGSDTFDMKAYALFYCNQDVRILAEGLIRFNGMCRDGLGIDCLNTISISGLANKYFEEHVYFKSNNIYKVGGNVRTFMMDSVFGGRCMVRDNGKYEVNERVVDFDAVSLYPSAIKRAYILEGKPYLIPKGWTKEYLLQHLFEDDQTSPTRERFISGFFVRIRITKVGRELHMPLITNKFDKTLPLNVNACVEMVVNHITLQDLIHFQEIEFDLVEGFYYAANRNVECQKVIQYLFDQRKLYKAQHNPIEQTFKLVMNSVYGKTIMKPVNSKIRLINSQDAFDKYEQKNYNHIRSVDKLAGSDTYQVKTINSLTRDYNLAQFGSIILSMSKRIMCEVFCLAEELGHTIYYTDTDSGHFRECEIDELADAFEKRYGRKLIGSDLGQFHCDFNNIANDASMPVSVKSLFLGKKSYIDMLQDDKSNLAFHVRMKGIPADSLERTANAMFKDAIPVHYKNGLFVPDRNEGADACYSIFELYRYMYNDGEVDFELVSEHNPRFEFKKDRTIVNKRSFKRHITFKHTD